MKPYPLIGLEVHLQLNTKTKVFCRCENRYGGVPNTRVCPICMGMPGTLLKLNDEVVNYAIKIGLALNCELTTKTKFDRKNYMYADLPKGYQTSQNDKPLCHDGFVEISTNDGKRKKIRIERIHMEEDTAKLIHMDNSAHTYVDYNRNAAPLLEIVSRPDISNGDEAEKYLTGIKEIAEYIEVSNCNMEEGSLRCDANISVQIPLENGETVSTPIAEIKNINSFKNVKKAIDYEVNRLLEEYNKTKEVKGDRNKTTRGWDDVNEVTVFQRAKGEESDYRCLPEYDLAILDIPKERIEEVRKTLPELPEEKRVRFVKQYDITEYDASILVHSKKIAQYFEDVALSAKNYKKAANLILTDVFAILKDRNISIEEFDIKPSLIGELVELIDSGTINSSAAKKIFMKMVETKQSPAVILKEENLTQIDESELIEIIDKVLKENPKSIEDYKKGTDNALKYLMGQVMKMSKGRANPVRATEIITKRIE